MANFDKQRVAPVAMLERLGAIWDGAAWRPPAASPALSLTGAADAMYWLLEKRATNLAGCIEASPEEDELREIADALDGYEVRRWIYGKTPSRSDN